MLIEIRFIPLHPYEGGSVVHVGAGRSKKECLDLIGETEPEGLGVYEYTVHTHKVDVFASTSDYLAVEKTLDRIFDK